VRCGVRRVHVHNHWRHRRVCWRVYY
jgi:hypothetical protein